MRRWFKHRYKQLIVYRQGNQLTVYHRSDHHNDHNDHNGHHEQQRRWLIERRQFQQHRQPVLVHPVRTAESLLQLRRFRQLCFKLLTQKSKQGASPVDWAWATSPDETAQRRPQ